MCKLNNQIQRIYTCVACMGQPAELNWNSLGLPACFRHGKGTGLFEPD